MELASLINELINEAITEKSLSAYKKLKKILKQKPEDSKLRFNLAVIEQRLDFNQEAKANYKYLIKSNKDFKSITNLYLMEIKDENYENALKLIDNGIEINPTYETIKKDKAFILYKINKLEESKKICEFFISQNKKDITSLNILGLCYFVENNFEKAEFFLKQALMYDENNMQILNSLGRLFHEKRESKQAERFFLKALKIDENSFQIINNLAGFYREEGEYNKAIKFYEKALILNKDNPSIISNLAKTYFDLDKLDLAEKYSLKALKYNEEDGNIKKILSFVYLKKHNFKLGWIYFDGRLNISDFQDRNETITKMRKKLYFKNNLKKNLNLLVLREQGVGDELLYGSMYKDLLEQIDDVKIECDKRLLNLFRNSFPKFSQKFVEFGNISNNDDKIKSIENILYAGSLGKYFRRNIKDFNNKNYLIPDKILFKKYKKIIDSFKGKYKFGISWKSFKNRYSYDKSLSLENLKHILDFENCSFFNLQYGDIGNEIVDFESKFGKKINTIKELDIYNDFDSLAAFLKNLDMFITVSNSTAHLAGSLGVNTLLIKPKNHALFHYWNQYDENTPWYNSVTLISRADLVNENNLINKILFQ